ncbi:hypothetical protein H310_11609 [Aphanomyces invadans]|uniref:DDE Tnp4 domain-containing protein n=1 Tax=Aphanomyces invadans TaxID=157072 RepID=A0A024TLS2_9STRA|nr:hypothetical protein H310_11609 [Aphanomyces invadans]ETV94968.1 hypothetical protein H310_11609 [Aphanomyces invadans]|eukprot:XP_008876559.1 hypothetical protein H310_11609 [Aphanomyces invadans]
MNFAKMIHPFLLRRFVTSPNDKYSMALLATSGHQFSNFTYARYATDVNFQETCIPAGIYNEKKMNFSGKHYHYGHKVEVSVLPNGMAINCTRHIKGSVSDKAIFDGNLEFHVSALSEEDIRACLQDKAEV